MKIRLRPVPLLGMFLLLWSLQVSLLERIELGSVAPDLLLLYSTFLALFLSPAGGCSAAWLIGLAKDLTSAAPVGSFALLFTFGALLVCLTRRVLYARDPIAHLLVVFISALAMNLLYGTALWIRSEAMPYGLVLQRSAAIALYTAVLAPFVIGSLTLVFCRRKVSKQRRCSLPVPRSMRQVPVSTFQVPRP